MRRYTRFLILLLISLLPLMALATPASAQTATPASSDADWLLSLNFRSADLAVTDADTGRATLTVYGVDTDVLAFTDRPQRRAGFVPIEAFIASINSDAGDPPNAVLAISLADTDAGDEVVLVLNEASADQNGTVSFDVTITDQQRAGTPVPVNAEHNELPAGYLFVDDLDVPVHVPVNLCGNTVAPVGSLNPAIGNTCVNSSAKEIVSG
jgi:hypothetical protein